MKIHSQKLGLVNNFFQIALKIDKFNNEHYTSQIQKVYDYIHKYWEKNKTDLAISSFDLEECFTLIESQLKEAFDLQDEDLKQNLREVQFRLKLFLAEVLSEFSHHVLSSETMRVFGKILHEEKPIIITFNYDDFIEQILEHSSGHSSNWLFFPFYRFSN